MNGPHDLGGRDGFGPIDIDPDEPHFHAPWQARAMAVTIAAGATGAWTIDQSRSAREDRHPVDYYTSSYYEIWLKGLERLVVDHGLATPSELLSGRAESADHAPVKRILRAEDVPAALLRGSPADRPQGGSVPHFGVGDRVRTDNRNPRGHTRLPSYARDKVGIVEAICGYHIVADRSARGEEVADWLYTVRFDGETLWGDRAEPGSSVSIDAWEPYLRHV